MGFHDHWCAFSRDIQNEDAGSAIVRYADGTHASYSQNFITRRSAGKRGAIITGYEATLEFDWYSETIRIVDHHRHRVDTIKSTSFGGHGGGDNVLCRNFVDVVRGKAEPLTNILDGIRSVAMCLAAKRSCREQTFERIPDLEELGS